MISPYDENWNSDDIDALEMLALEIRMNDPSTDSDIARQERVTRDWKGAHRIHVCFACGTVLDKRGVDEQTSSFETAADHSKAIGVFCHGSGAPQPWYTVGAD